MKLIYLDNSATTKPFDEVIDTMCFNLQKEYFNPSSGYRQGIEVSKAIENSRSIIAKSIAAENSEIIFTSGGTESINTAVNSACEISKKTHIITSMVEHDATLKVMGKKEKEGYKVTYLKPNKAGAITWEDVNNAITEETFFVSLMQINNELGSITDIEEIGKNLYKQNIIFHVDAIQGFLKQKINVKQGKISMLSMSAHKVNGPKGIGALYVSKDTKFQPLILGGGQEAIKRSGTENVAGILGFAKATSIHLDRFEQNLVQYKNLKAKLFDLLNENIDDFVINSKDGADNIVNVSFLGVRSEVLLNSLSSKNILVSSGSACSSKKKASHVLEGIGLNKDRIEGAIRISFGVENTLEEIEEFVKVLKVEVEDIRRFTKYKKAGR